LAELDARAKLAQCQFVVLVTLVSQRVVVMTAVSLVKIVASVSVLIAAGSALVLGVTRVQHEALVAGDVVSATTSAPPAGPAVRSDARPAATETPLARTPTQVPTALAARGADPAAIAAELGGPPEAAGRGKNQSSPSFDIARIEASGDAVIAGRAVPGATVDLLRGGERLDRAVADASGEFVMIPPRLPAGSYELTLSEKLPDGTITSSTHGVAVTVNDAGSSDRAAQSRAEYIPNAVSQPQPSSEPRVPSGKPQESAGLQPAHAIHASSSPNDDSTSPAVAHAISSKIVSRGDSLWRISHITYGDGARYALVYRANRGRIRDPNLIYPGQTLVLPAKHN
jgi:nucleoid-associated protein YgaU